MYLDGIAIPPTARRSGYCKSRVTIFAIELTTRFRPLGVLIIDIDIDH